MDNVDIQRTLGRIEEEQKRTRKENKEISQQMGTVHHKQDTAEKERAAMAEQLAVVEKNTADFNKWKERAIGAVMLVSMIAALVGGGLAASWHKIVDLVRGW